MLLSSTAVLVPGSPTGIPDDFVLETAAAVKDRVEAVDLHDSDE